MNNMLRKITDHAIKSELDQLLPNTQSQLMGVYSIMVEVFNLSYLIGTCIELLEHIIKSRHIISLDKVENNMCFWACCALMHGCRRDKYITKTRELFTKYYGSYNNDYKGFDYISELPKFENTFEYGVNIIKYNVRNSMSYNYKSPYSTKEQKYINLCNNHFSYVTNIDKLAKLYNCDNCGSNFRDNFNLKKHNETNLCKSGTENAFEIKDKIWTKPRNIIIKICDYYNIPDLDFKYNYIATFDLESVLLKTPNESDNTDKLKYITTHVAVSASIASNIPKFTNTKFILSTNPRDLCDQLFNYFDQLSSAASELVHNKFKQLFSQDLNSKTRNKLIDYCSSLPIIGFNSSFYDVGLLSKDGFINNIITRDFNPFIIKDCNRYKVIKTNQFIFLDQMSYTAAGTSLKKFIKAYDINL